MKKLTALFLTLAMLLSVGAFAAEVDEATSDSLTGDGKLEAVYSKDVFKVVLPTVTQDMTTFDFILDPMNVIGDTADTQSYYFVEHQSSSMYFTRNVESAPGAKDGLDYYDYYDISQYYTILSRTSDKLTILNKSSFDIAVSVTAEVQNNGNISLTDDDSFYESDATSMFIKVQDADNTDLYQIVDPTSKKATITKVVKYRPNSYELVSQGTDSVNYYYQLDTDLLDADFVDYYSYSFQLSGACNTKADWTKMDVASTQPQVQVTWSVEKDEAPAAPSTDDLALTVTASSGDWTIDLATALPDWDRGAGTLKATAISSITYPSSMNQAQKDLVTLVSGTSIKITAEGVSLFKANALPDYYVTLVLNDAGNTEVDLYITG